MRRDPEAFLVNAYNEYGPVFRIRLAMDDYTVLMGEEARAFFLRCGERGLTREPFYGRFARELGCDYFVLSEPQGGGKHIRLRKMMRLGFSRESAAAYIGHMIEAVRATALDWRPGSCIPVMDAMARLTFQLYGFVMADLDLISVFEDARRYAHTIMMIGARLAPPIALKMPAYRRSKAAVFALMRQLLADARTVDRRERPNLTILDALLQAFDSASAAESEAEVISAALYGFVGTIVYMNRAVSFLLYELAKNPGTMERATQEADAAFADGSPTAETLRRAAYLRAAFQESLRRHPVAIGLPFCAERDIEFEGHRIPAGETILISHLMSHFTPEHFRDPWKFEPERFLPPRSEHRAKGAMFAPYGFGGRACSAVGLVEAIVLCTVATLLHTVKFELECPGYSLRTEVHPLPGPEESFRLRIVEHRSPASPGSLPPLEEAITDVLEDLSTNDRMKTALEGLELRAFAPGAEIIRQGDYAEDFFILMEGDAAVWKEQGDGITTEVARLRPGQYFGEIGLLNGGRRTATVRALDARVRVLAMNREEFLGLVTDLDVLSGDIALMARRHFMAERLRRAMPTLGGRDLAAHSDRFRLERIPPGAVIFRQGDVAETFHVLAAGEAEVVLEKDGGEQVLAHIGPGEYFGEMGLLMRRPRTATVRATAKGADILTMTRESFDSLVGGSKATLDEVLLRLMQRVGALLDNASKPG